jgi:hypothetical protein
MASPEWNVTMDRVRADAFASAGLGYHLAAVLVWLRPSLNSSLHSTSHQRFEVVSFA